MMEEVIEEKNDGEYSKEKCTDIIGRIKEAELETMNRDRLIYGETSHNVSDDVESFDFVLTQITETVNMFESAKIDSNRSVQDSDVKLTSDDFVSFSTIQKDIVEDNTEAGKSKAETQWDYNTQMVEIAKNTDTEADIFEDDDYFDGFSKPQKVDMAPEFEMSLNFASDLPRTFPSDDFDKFEQQLSQKSNASTMSFPGFTTANNSPIIISEEARKKVERIFNELEPIGAETTDSEFTTLNNDTPNFNTGFTTANNKPINISTNALNKFKHIFSDLDTTETAPINTGFSTANNEPIKVSDDALNKASHIFTDLDPIEAQTINPGFSTASNKPIKISDGALNKASRIFTDIDPIEGQTINPGFSTASNKPIKISDDAVRKAANLLNEPEPNFGFTTANNKPINVSTTALNKIKHIFGDLDSTETVPINSGFSTASNKPINLSDDAVRKAMNLLDEPEPNVGFMTANNKPINISTKALKKVEHVFSDLTGDEAVNLKTQDMEPHCSKSIGFTTANNKPINVSDATLKKVERMFDGMNSSADIPQTEIIPNTGGFSTASNKPIEISAAAMNRVMNVFNSIDEDKAEDVFNDEFEFKNSQDDASVFSCDNTLLGNIETVDEVAMFDEVAACPLSPIIEFRKLPNKRVLTSDNRPIKRQRLDVDATLNLGDLYNEKLKRGKAVVKLDELTPIKLDVAHLNPDNYLNYVFPDATTIGEVVDMFTNHRDVDRKLIPAGWVLNHIKWIVWKLASYERTFECDAVLTVSNVLKQLKYRYDRELYRAERPIVRKILEKDETSTKRMVLCVSKILPSDKTIEDNLNVKYELELTDGWYGIIASIDAVLSSVIERHKIVVGTKLMIFGAELLNCSGLSPLEDISKVRLKIWANGCRRCKRWVKLGLYSGNCGPIPLNLEDCTIGGGPVSILRLVPVTLYPVLYFNKLSDGSIIPRSEKLQEIHDAKSEVELQAKIELLYSQVEKEFEEPIDKNLARSYVPRKDDSPERLAQILVNASDPQEFTSLMSEDQVRAVQDFIAEKHARTRQQIDDKVKAMMNEQGLAKNNVVKVLKCRILSPGRSQLKSAVLTIWKPDDSVIELIREGSCFDVTNLTLTGMRSDELQLSAGRRSTFTEITASKFANIEQYKRTCIRIEDMYVDNFSPRFNEVDFVGIVVAIEPETLGSNRFQAVYLADEASNVVSVIFWGGLSKYGYERTIRVDQRLACAHLQYRNRSSVKKIQLHATELSTFTCRPKKLHLQTALNNLQSKLNNMDVPDYIEQCNDKLKLTTNETSVNISKENMNESDLKGSDSFFKTKVNISAILNERRSNLNTSTSSVEMKIEKLKMFGEAPPLSPMTLIASKRLRKSFTSPVMNKAESKLQRQNTPSDTDSLPMSLD